MNTRGVLLLSFLLVWAGICPGWSAARAHGCPDLYPELLEAARTGGVRLEVSADGRRALLLRESFQVRPATTDRTIPLDTTPIWSSADDFAVGGLLWVDVDGDGDLDLASAHYEGGYPARPEETRVWTNDAGSLETTASWISADQLWSTELACADLDGNGHPDLVVANWGANKIHFHDGTGLETSPSWTSSESLFSLGLAFGDVTGDGYPELAVSNQPVYPDPGQPNHLYTNTNGTPGSSAGWTSGDIASNMACALGDYDQDASTSPVLLFDGDGARRIFRLLGPADGVQSASVDGAPTTEYTVHLLDGWIAFWEPPPAGVQNVAVTLSRSTDPDLAISVDHGNAKVYHDLGSTLETMPSFTVSGTGDRREKGVSWVDVDGDGDLDLFVGGRTVPLLLYENQSGTLNAVAVWSSDDADPDCQELDWADVDRDGDLDLATANSTESPIVRVYENVGGTLETTESWGLPWGGSMAQAVSWGDVDSDGWPDLAVAYSGAPIQVYRNLGAGLPTPTPVPTGEPTVLPTPFSPTPVPTATATALGTVTPEPTAPPPYGVRLELPTEVHPGETFQVTGILDNPGAPRQDVPTFFLLEVEGHFWFWPSWSWYHPPDSESIDFRQLAVPSGSTPVTVVPAFVWPDTGTEVMTGLAFYGAFLTPDLSAIDGEWSRVEWGYGPA